MKTSEKFPERVGLTTEQFLTEIIASDEIWEKTGLGVKSRSYYKRRFETGKTIKWETLMKLAQLTGYSLEFDFILPNGAFVGKSAKQN